MKELIKSFLLIGLTISAIIMTGAVFITEEVEIPVETIDYETTDLIEYIKPQNYVFSFGDLFIKLYDDEYNGYSLKSAYEKAFQSFIGSSAEFNRAEISQRIWQEQMSRKSLTINYPFNIKLSDFLEIIHYSVEDEPELYMTSVLFVLNNTDVIYIYDGVNDKYHRLTGDESSEWVNEVYDIVNSDRPKASSYKTIEERYNFTEIGLKKYNLTEANHLLTPISGTISFPVYYVTKEASSGLSSTSLEDFANSVFGDDLSFVKKSVTSNESTIFMYGYGEEILKINSDGSLEYIVKTEASPQNEFVDFREGLHKAINQINKMGVLIKSYYLADYYQEDYSKETVYLFNYHKDGIPFFNKNGMSGHSIEVRFTGDVLALVEKHARIVTSINLNTIQEAVSFESVLLKNRVKLELQYLVDRPDTEISERDIFQMCLQEMEFFEVFYYVEDDQLIPVWRVKIAKTEYIFDLTTGEIILDKEL